MLDNSKGLGFGVCNRFFNTVIVWVIGDLMRGSEATDRGKGVGGGSHGRVFFLIRVLKSCFRPLQMYRLFYRFLNSKSGE